MRTRCLLLPLLPICLSLVGCESYPTVLRAGDEGPVGAGGDDTRPPPRTGGRDPIDIGDGGVVSNGGSDVAANSECGNGLLEPGELCDDGGKRDGDGCSADCLGQDEDYQCTEPGEECVKVVVCGSGVLEGDEICDDANAESGDGCSEDCSQIEEGWACPRPGRACVESPDCGNGVLERGEACDDENTESGDGCTGTEESDEEDAVAGCQLEEGYFCPAAGEDCVALECGDGNRTPDETCDDGNTEAGDGCSDGCAVEAGWRCSSSGCYPECGDGRVVGQEACDDEDRTSGDGCSAACTVEPFWACEDEPSTCASTIECGNSEVDPGEICDPPGRDGCLLDCRSFAPETTAPAECGNSVIEPGETCDPPGDGCDDTCQARTGFTCPRPGTCLLLPICGDGLKQVGEECDVGPDGSAGCVDCEIMAGWTCIGVQPSVCAFWSCGDGTRQLGEACDDGNAETGDGCAACQEELGWHCSSSGCSTICGDGRVVAGEQCDDGDRSSGDGCSAACRIEPFYACNDEPSVCTSTIVCGDGRVDPGELCDPPGTDGCREGCTSFTPDSADPPECGNSTIELGEGCDPPGTGCSDICLVAEGYVCPRPGVCLELPECGNGLREVGEQCDDGNPDLGDGCENCVVQTDWICFGVQPTLCELPDCGDGQRQFGEECDDGDAAPEDGCSATCTVEEGWVCPEIGEDCWPVCGDGELLGEEQCDDGNPDNDDGCNAACRFEPGWYCPDLGQPCEEADCGNGREEPGEGCDLGDEIAGDGCSPTCQDEPVVVVGPDPEVRVFCGDGMVTGTEICDDGNTLSGDGCSGTEDADPANHCQEEDGFACDDLPQDLGSIAFRVTYRDFYQRNETGGHPHMKRSNVTPPQSGSDRGIPGAVCTTSNGASCGRLDAQGKPQLEAGVTSDNIDTEHPTLYSHPDAFSLWYRSSNPGGIEGLDGDILIDDLVSSLTLTRSQPNVYFYDSTAFWPLDDLLFGDTPGQTHNFQFTTELRYFFQYQGGETLTFRGDDDVFVYVNGRLAVDIGGIHNWQYARVILGDDGLPSGTDSNCTFAGADGVALPNCTLSTAESDDDEDERFGLVRGNVYEIVLFHAERHPIASNFRLTLAGFLAPRSACDPICGDSQVVGWEVCDDGEDENTGEYGACNETCTGRTFCGDAVVQSPDEECDNGRNLDTYDTGTPDGCGPGCVVPTERCGDGVIQAGWEECDNGDGVNSNTAYGPTACTLACEYGPFCGDGTVQETFEACDLGLQNGGHGLDSCGYDCQPGPYCGDGIRNGDEECDGGDFCSDDCLIEGYCGDGLFSPSDGEECDWGLFASEAYGACTAACELGPYCGDGVRSQPEEECDLGEVENTGAYDGCSPDCTLGPRCGDGQVQSSAGELCDNGFNDDTYRTGAADECGAGCQPPAAFCGDGVLDPSYEECDSGEDNSEAAYGATGCTPICTLGGFCGDGVVNGPEVCDRGILNGQEYGPDACSYDCQAGPRCGDGIRNGTEECDGTEHCASDCTLERRCGDGVVDEGEACDYGQFASDAYGSCTDACEWGPRCGDGTPDVPYEECDLGAEANDGGYDGCAEDCTLGPQCGDGVLQEEAEEECDNGFNDDAYAYDAESCGPDCELPPSCGDGAVQPAFELCDEGEDNSDTEYNGCTTSCTWGPYCGDGNLDPEEKCDEGLDNTLYSASGEGCGYDCAPAPYCGDGVRNGPEECDDGTDENTGDYGECSPECELGPRCGDGVVQRSEGEECDEGPIGSVTCSPECRSRAVVR